MVQRVRDTQWDLAADVDVILDEMRAYTAALLPTVGSDLSHAEALEELQVVTIKAFARCLEQRRR